MKQLYLLNDNTDYSKKCIELALSFYYSLDIIDIDNKSTENTFSMNFFNKFSGNNVFIAADEQFFSMLRMNLLKVILSKKAFLINLISQNIRIPSHSILGKNIFIGDNVFLGENVVIGDGAIIDSRAIIMHNCIIGKGVFIGREAVIGSNSLIGSNTVIGSKVFIDSIKVGSKCKVFNMGRYSADIPTYTSFIENHSEPITYRENLLC